MKIYAFLGRKRSGKDTAANILYETLCTTMCVKRVSFAGPIKDALIELTGSQKEYFYDQTYKESKVIGNYTPRDLMIWYGMLMRDKFGSEFWVDKVKKRIENEKCECVLITDVRFEEEVKMLNSCGAKIIYMDRDSILGPMSGNEDMSEKVVYESKKWAENNAKDFIVINNNNSFEQLVEQIRHI